MRRKVVHTVQAESQPSVQHLPLAQVTTVSHFCP
jgi:hypothetical protein